MLLALAIAGVVFFYSGLAVLEFTRRKLLGLLLIVAAPCFALVLFALVTAGVVRVGG